MKQKYQPIVDRFISEQGHRYRHLKGRWWVQTDGYWRQSHGREQILRELHGYLKAFAPPLIHMDVTQSDLGQISAYLARKFHATGLPAGSVSPDSDPDLIMWDVRPRQYRD